MKNHQFCFEIEKNIISTLITICIFIVFFGTNQIKNTSHFQSDLMQLYTYSRHQIGEMLEGIFCTN